MAKILECKVATVAVSGSGIGGAAKIMGLPKSTVWDLVNGD